MEGLGINLPSLIAQIISFVILFVLLRKFAFKPFMRKLDERSERIKDSMDQAELVKEQAAHAEEAVKKQLGEAAKDGQEIIARAVRTGEDLRQGAQQQAKQEAATLITRAHVEIQRERDEAIDELRREFAGLTILAAEKVIDSSLDKQAHRQLIDKIMEESTTLKKG